MGLYATSSKRPIQHKVFLESHSARQSYWARNFVGWPRWSGFLPNINHLSLARWEQAGRLSCLVTQNVDQLHYKASSIFFLLIAAKKTVEITIMIRSN